MQKLKASISVIAVALAIFGIWWIPATVAGVVIATAQVIVQQRGRSLVDFIIAMVGLISFETSVLAALITVALACYDLSNRGAGVS